MKPKIAVLISAAEPSGDAHAANFVREVLRRRPDFDFHGFGGERLAAAGCLVHCDLIRLSAMAFGFLGHIHRYFGIVRTFDRLLRELRPATVVLVDSPGLNFIFARLARWRGVPIVYYICPQIWAWAPWRRSKVLRYTDLLLTILPFETAIYQNSRVPVKFVGHPLGDVLSSFPTDAGERLHDRLKIEVKQRVIGVLPGSRTQEVRELMPLYRQILDHMELDAESTRILISCFRDEFEEVIRTAMEGTPLPYELLKDDPKAITLASDFVLVASGTASLEVAYFARPMLVLYRASVRRYLLFKFLRTTPFFALPNILGASLFDGEPVVPERLCLGHEGPELARLARSFFDDEPRRRRTVERLSRLRDEYLRPGATERAAEEFIAFVVGDPTIAV